MVKTLLYRKRFCTALTALCAIILLSWLAKAVSFTPYKAEHQGYIAHACGNIDGIKYTNSREALENCIKRGQFTIEIDLRKTTDNELVAVHKWGQFSELDTVMSSQEFKTVKIMGKYTTLMATQIDSIWKANPELILVTDKTSDPEMLNKYFYDIRDRVIVEAFSPHDYFTLAEMGYKNVYYSGYLPFTKWLKALWKYGEPINAYVVPLDNYLLTRKGLLSRWFINIFKCKHAVADIKNVEQADSLMRAHPDIEYVYIDEI